MLLWTYDDYSGWGAELGKVARERGHDVRKFEDPRLVDRGVVFARIHHHPSVRARDKAVMAYLAVNRDVTLIPGYRSALLYDDKAEQARHLARWMPRTVVAYSIADADRAIEILGLPLISKCSEGAGSYNVAMIATREQAMAEAALAFSGEGIPRHYGQSQRGYLLWQRFCSGNDYDFRVIAIGQERLILRRGNRDDRPMASGSNKEMPIKWPDREADEVLAFADLFFATECFLWCGVDIVKGEQGWTLLEMTTGWPLNNMAAHRFVSGRPGSEYWQIVMDEIEAGRCI